MYKIGQDIDVGGGNRARIQEDNEGNLFYVHPISKNKNIVVSGREREQLGESFETGFRQVEDEESILRYLIESESPQENAHDAINEIIFNQDEVDAYNNSINQTVAPNINRSAAKGLTTAGKFAGKLTPNLGLINTIKKASGKNILDKLDSVGENLAGQIIGQNPETGEIPEQEHPYNPILNLLLSNTTKGRLNKLNE